MDAAGTVVKRPLTAYRPFSEMLPTDFGAMRDPFMSQTSGCNPSLYTNMKKPKATKKPKR